MEFQIERNLVFFFNYIYHQIIHVNYACFIPECNFFYNIAFLPECLINKIDMFDIKRTFDMDIHLINHDQLLCIIYFIKGI